MSEPRMFNVAVLLADSQSVVLRYRTEDSAKEVIANLTNPDSPRKIIKDDYGVTFHRCADVAGCCLINVAGELEAAGVIESIRQGVHKKIQQGNARSSLVTPERTRFLG